MFLPLSVHLLTRAFENLFSEIDARASAMSRVNAAFDVSQPSLV